MERLRQVGAVLGGSVLERARELNLVIDQAMALHEGKNVDAVAGERYVFGLWRSWL